MKGNLALTDLLIRGTLSLKDENGCLDERALNLSLKSRSRGASLRALKEAATTSGIVEASGAFMRGGGREGKDGDAGLQNPGKVSPLFLPSTGNGLSGSAKGSVGPTQLAALEGSGDQALSRSSEESGGSPPPPPGLEGVRIIREWRGSPPSFQ